MSGAPLGASGLALIAAGWVATGLVGWAAEMANGPVLVARLQQGAGKALASTHARGVVASFADRHGWLTRHALLAGGDNLPDGLREQAAAAVAAVPGMGGVHWATRHGVHHAEALPAPVLDCQAHVEAILRTRSIRFAESSAAIDPASNGLLDEVATALRPCAGSIIAITGHTDAKGDEAANQSLSIARAVAVRNELGARGIDLAGLRARGLGSARPVPGLDAADPANRRIEFSVIAPASLEPTPVDTPGAG